MTPCSSSRFNFSRDPEHASIAVTQGLREKLNREELQGVIAHEMSHVQNYDIRLMLLMAVLVGTVVMLADLFWQITWYTSPGSSRESKSDRDGKDGGGGGIIALVLLVAAGRLAIIA